MSKLLREINELHLKLERLENTFKFNNRTKYTIHGYMKKLGVRSVHARFEEHLDKMYGKILVGRNWYPHTEVYQLVAPDQHREEFEEFKVSIAIYPKDHTLWFGREYLKSDVELFLRLEEVQRDIAKKVTA